MGNEAGQNVSPATFGGDWSHDDDRGPQSSDERPLLPAQSADAGTGGQQEARLAENVNEGTG